MFNVRAAQTSVRSGLLIIAGLVSPSGICHAQAAPGQTSADQPTLTLSTTATLIVLDVVVIDSAGKPVNTLDRSAFTIREDKTPQPIYSFDPPSAHRMPASVQVRTSADLRKIGNAPVTILVLDELNTPWEQIAYAREEIEHFIAQQPAVLSQPTQILAAGDSRFKVLCDYTQDRAELLNAIKKHFPEHPFELERDNSDLGAGAIERMVKTLGVLEQIADSTRGTPGRKNLLWVGGGYPDIDPSLLIGAGEQRLTATIREATARMLAAHVTLSTVDPAGVSSQVNIVPLDADSQNTAPTVGPHQLGPYTGALDFGNFAPATGGHAYFGRNDLGHQIGAAVAEGSDYYTLSYRPSAAGTDAGAYRRVRVTVNNPALKVITRDGYFSGAGRHIEAAPTAVAKTAQQLEYDLWSAARSRLPYNGIEMAAAPAKGKPGFIVRMRANNLNFHVQPDGSRKAELTVIAIFFDAKEKELSHKATEIKLGLAGSGQLDAKSVAGYDSPVEPPPGAARVRFVVRDAATGLIGTADVTL